MNCYLIDSVLRCCCGDGDQWLGTPLHMFYAAARRPPEHPGRMAPCPPAAAGFDLSSARWLRRLPLYLRHPPRVL